MLPEPRLKTEGRSNSKYYSVAVVLHHKFLTANLIVNLFTGEVLKDRYGERSWPPPLLMEVVDVQDETKGLPSRPNRNGPRCRRCILEGYRS